MESPQPRRSSVGDYSPGVIAIIAIPGVVMLLFALNWVASQIGKIHSLPTAAVWITAVAALPLFVFGVVEIVMYYRSYPRNVWIHSWIAFVAIGLLYEVFAIAWIYRSALSHVTIVIGLVLMVFGWVLYIYQRQVTQETISDNPPVPFIGIATLCGFVGGAFSWILQHPARLAVVRTVAQVQTDPSTAANLGNDIVVIFKIAIVALIVLGVLRLLKMIGIIK